MGEWRGYGYAGDDSGCKWCGKKLRQKYNSTFERITFTPKKCRSCGSSNIDENRSYIGASGGLWYCNDCGAHVDNRRRKMISREKQYDKPGDYGDGHFCGLRCGYQFAVAMAGNGKKFKAKEVQS